MEFQFKYLIVFIFFIWTDLFAQPLTYNDEMNPNAIAGVCKYLLDSSNQTIEEISTRSFYKDYGQDIYYNNNPVWIKFELFNDSKTENFLLTIDQWEYAELYFKTGNNHWNSIKSGTSMNVHDRPESLHRLLSFPIHQPSQTAQTYYIKVRNEREIIWFYASFYQFLTKLEWQKARESRYKYTVNQSAIAFIIGICFFLILYNSFLFYFTPKWELIYLIAYITSMALFIANTHGITSNFIFTGTHGYELPLGLFLAFFTTILIALYIKRFLKLKGISVQNMLLLFLIFFMIVTGLISFALKESFWFFPRRYVEMLVLSATLILAIYKKQKGAIYLICAVSSAYIGQYISVFIVATGDSSFVIDDIPFLVGVLIQLVLFTTGSSLRVKTLEKNVQLSLEREKILLENQNEKLNIEVVKRTKELEQAIRALNLKSIDLNNLNVNLEKRVIERTKNLVKANQELDRFVYSASHELGAPIKTIEGLIYLINYETDPKKIQEIYQKINQSLGKLNMVIKYLGEYSKNKEKTTKRKHVVLHNLVDDILLNHEKVIKDRNIAFDKQIDNKATIKTDKFRLNIVLSNLISNAIKYQDPKKEISRISIKYDCQGGQHLIEVEDNGIGISTNDQDRIFNMFFRATEISQGSGLGLFIAKEAVEKINGNLTLTSTLKKGTKFVISLPKAE